MVFFALFFISTRCEQYFNWDLSPIAHITFAPFQPQLLPLSTLLNAIMGLGQYQDPTDEYVVNLFIQFQKDVSLQLKQSEYNIITISQLELVPNPRLGRPSCIIPNE